MFASAALVVPPLIFPYLVLTLIAIHPFEFQPLASQPLFIRLYSFLIIIPEVVCFLSYVNSKNNWRGFSWMEALVLVKVLILVLVKVQKLVLVKCTDISCKTK